VLVFAGVGPVRAAAVCERVRLAIEDFDWPSLAPGLAVTASLGVCDIAGHAGPAEGLARADALIKDSALRKSGFATYGLVAQCPA
jgi:diguanylate cyclase